MSRLAKLKNKVEFLKMKDYCRWFTTIFNCEDYELLKNGWNKAIRRYENGEELKILDDTDFWNKYNGLTKDESAKVNNILVKFIISGKWPNKNEVIDTISNEIEISKDRAELIATTELSNFANRVRIEMYKNNTRVKFVRIENENDGRVCDLCKKIAQKTRRGIPINELEYRLREWTNGLSRGLVIHPRCRCIVVRVDKRNRRWWE